MIWWILAVAFGTAQAEEKDCAVKHVSAEHVYLDAGSTAGLAPGVQVRVTRSQQDIALLEVVFTAQFSASCKVVSQTGDILPGDTAIYMAVDAAEPPAPTPETHRASRTRTFPVQGTRPVDQPGPGSPALWPCSGITATSRATAAWAMIC